MISLGWIYNNFNRSLKERPEWSQIKRAFESKDATYETKGCLDYEVDRKLTDLLNSWIVENGVVEKLKSWGLKVEFTDPNRDYLYDDTDSITPSNKPDIVIFDREKLEEYEIKIARAWSGIVSYIKQGVENRNFKKRCAIHLHGAKKAFYYDVINDKLYLVKFHYYKEFLYIDEDSSSESGLAIIPICEHCNIQKYLRDREDLLND